MERDEAPAPAPVFAGAPAPPGRYQCQVCGTRVTHADGGVLPACPYCHGTEFRRVHD